MKSVKRYTSFEDLKSSKEKPSDYKTRLKRHKEFEKFITSVSTAINQKKVAHQSK